MPHLGKASGFVDACHTSHTSACSIFTQGTHPLTEARHQWSAGASCTSRWSFWIPGSKAMTFNSHPQKNSSQGESFSGGFSEQKQVNTTITRTRNLKSKRRTRLIIWYCSKLWCWQPTLLHHPCLRRIWLRSLGASMAEGPPKRWEPCSNLQGTLDEARTCSHTKNTSSHKTSTLQIYTLSLSTLKQNQAQAWKGSNSGQG